MRAVRLHELGGVPQLDEIDPPRGAGLARVVVGALNPIDITIGSGRFYGGSPDLPYVIGSEAVATLDGRRLWLRGRNNLFAELVDPAGGWAFEIPAGVDDATALACGIAGLTAWLAVSWRVPVRPDDTVLVLGASGSLGSVAVQAAKLLGAKRVIGCARETDRVPSAADEVVDLRSDGPLPEATLIVDPLWGKPLERALAAAATGVRVVHMGQIAGPTATLESGWVRGKAADIHGHSLYAIPHEVGERGYRELCEHARDGRIRIETETLPVADVAKAWERQASGSPGSKLLLQF